MIPKADHNKVTSDELALLYTAIHPGHPIEGREVNFGWFFITQCIQLREEKRTIHMGGMVTWLAHELGFGAMCDACEGVEPRIALDIPTLRQYKFLQGSEDDEVIVWKVDGKPYCNLPNSEKTRLGENLNRWLFPKDGEEEDDDDDEGGDDDDDDDEGDGDDDDDADEGGGNDQTMQDLPQAQTFPSHHPYGAGSSSTPSSFDPYHVFPPSYFGSSTTAPPPPRDPYDLTPMYQMLGALHQYRAEDRAYAEDTRRIVWHDHLGLVNSGLVPGFANHPAHPPDFDSPHLPLQQFPQHFPPNHPYYRPPPPHDP